ncbi:esterase/lipase family protein [Marinobacter sp. F4216]|uniref:esterase/lipase family protein n=1 Tax=Marinobacter sp. F4216 TaxID=2874281 RepID=UPI001CBE1455|nr:alpha/beta hydrolase [Marinobacter sp. F4216]MBZ2169474.1 alpha/beta hydrolase [Marinobacter sp. F4216]
MRVLLLAALLACSLPAAASCVVLLHGLARTADSMETLEHALLDAGFFPINDTYPSRDHPIEELAELAIPPALEKCPQGMAVNFVTHSLGGILVRQYLSEHSIENLGRVVMLGPPNQGSEVVDELRDVPGFHFINGDAGLQLGTGEFSVPKALGKARFDVGIIAGTQSINWILSTLIPDTDDGKVSVENTRLEGMNDHITMPVTHPFMMEDDEVIAQVIHYLKNGQFFEDESVPVRGL